MRNDNNQMKLWASTLFQTYFRINYTGLFCKERYCTIIVKVPFKSVSHLPKRFYFYLLQWKPFKNDENCLLFHLKSSFRSQDIQIFILTFWSCRRNGLIRKTRLISKFWRRNLVNKQLQYTYCPISHKEKTTRHLTLVRQ